MFVGVLLALLGVVLGFAVIYAYRVWHASVCGCVSCDEFVQLRGLDPLVRLVRRLSERKP